MAGVFVLPQEILEVRHTGRRLVITDACEYGDESGDGIPIPQSPTQTHFALVDFPVEGALHDVRRIDGRAELDAKLIDRVPRISGGSSAQQSSTCRIAASTVPTMSLMAISR
jgi:hypothetical protein